MRVVELVLTNRGLMEKFFEKQRKRNCLPVSNNEFYTEDFVPSGKARDLASYVNPHRQEPLPANYRIKFIDYDWTINQQPQ